MHSVGVFCVSVALLAKAPTHQTAKQVFATYYDESGWGDRASPAYVALTGCVLLSCNSRAVRGVERDCRDGSEGSWMGNTAFQRRRSDFRISR